MSLYTALQVSSGLASNAELPSALPPSVNQAYLLSDDAIRSRRCDDRDAVGMYSDRRLFGNIPVSQSFGDVSPVTVAGRHRFMNPTFMQSVIEGRGFSSCEGDDLYRGDRDAALTPMSTYGAMAGGYRAEAIVGTVSEHLNGPRRSELQISRSFLPSEVPSTYNIIPVSEYALTRKQNVCRLNTIQANATASTIAAFSSGQF